jgi:hypothetical protein
MRVVVVGLGLAATLAVGTVGCPAPSDYTPQIRVVKGAAARIALIQSHNRASRASETAEEDVDGGARDDAAAETDPEAGED